MMGTRIRLEMRKTKLGRLDEVWEGLGGILEYLLLCPRNVWVEIDEEFGIWEGKTPPDATRCRQRSHSDGVIEG